MIKLPRARLIWFVVVGLILLNVSARVRAEEVSIETRATYTNATGANLTSDNTVLKQSIIDLSAPPSTSLPDQPPTAPPPATTAPKPITAAKKPTAVKKPTTTSSPAQLPTTVSTTDTSQPTNTVTSNTESVPETIVPAETAETTLPALEPVTHGITVTIPINPIIPLPQYRLSWVTIVSLVAIGLLLIFYRRWVSQSSTDETMLSAPDDEAAGPLTWLNRRLARGLLLLAVTGSLALVAYRSMIYYPASADVDRVDWGKYAIWMGWSVPTLTDYENQPELLNDGLFDGIVIQSTQFNANNLSFHADTFNPFKTLTLTDFQPVVQRWLALRAQSTSLQHSLLRVNLNLGFTDSRQLTVASSDADWNQVVANFREAVKVAKAAHLEGIVLDTEAYSNAVGVLDYPPQYNGVDLAQLGPTEFAAAEEELRNRLEERGRQLAAAASEVVGSDDFVIMLTYADSIFNPPLNFNLGWQAQRLELLPQLVDGLLLGAGDRVEIIDGYERSYRIKTGTETALDQFTAARQSMLALDKAAKFSRHPDLYHSKIKTSFGLYLDNPGLGWYYQRADGQWYQVVGGGQPDVPVSADGGNDRNYFSPPAIQNSLRAALLQSDRYVWVHSEPTDIFGTTARHYPTSSRPLHTDYQTALRTVRSGADELKVNLGSCDLSGPTNLIAGHRYQATARFTPAAVTDRIIRTVAVQQPAGLQLDAITGQVDWQPTADQLNSQSITWKVGDGLQLANCAVSFVVAPSAPNLAVTIRADSDDIQRGSRVSYHLTVTNNGNDLAQQPNLKVVLPSGWRIVGQSGAANHTDSEVRLNDVAAGTSQSFSIEVST